MRWMRRPGEEVKFATSHLEGVPLVKIKEVEICTFYELFTRSVLANFLFIFQKLRNPKFY